ncbi:hypothetical protein GCM10022409_10210 [Hymenobacter glaciei]|uniref:Uncharacterized protein n=1 Tax=Hymenobacter glaciei TaxID=877209 RepID=A0ABP7TLK6_9BACT
MPFTLAAFIRLAPTSPTLYFNNALGRVYDYSPDYVRIDWQTAPVTHQDLRAVYEHTLHLLKRSGLRRVLSDHRLMPPYTPEDRDWLLREWVPRAIAEAGYSHCAVVQAHEAANRQTTQQLVEEAGKTALVVQCFAALHPALTWLLAQ